MINIKYMKKISLFLILIFTIILSSCSQVSEKNYSIIKKAVEKSNSETKYKASFVLEVKENSSEELIMFAQGSYSIDKSKSTFDSVIMNGELVQTVYNTPSSLRIGFYDDTYVTISDEYKILSDLSEETLLKQFMCSDAISFNIDEIESIKKSEVSNGCMYTVDATDGLNQYFIDLLGDDLYSFSGMKQPQKSLTSISEIICKYVISDENVLLSRESNYTVNAYDTVPYFPGHQATNDDYKRVFSVSLKINYKEYGENVSVNISDFLPDETSANSTEK